MVESIYRRLATASAPIGDSSSVQGLSGKLSAIYLAAADVNRSIFFAAGIIIAGFLPLFTLSGVAGHLFAPMAKTYAHALAGGLLANLSVPPAISPILFAHHCHVPENPGGRVL